MVEVERTDSGIPTPAGPRAVVVPFGVPESAKGLGLGIAALIHHFARLSGDNVALAQLLSRPADSNAAPTPVEAFLSPHAWTELEARGDAPRGVEVVLTGAFEPPEGASGVLDVIAFEPKTGRVLASVEVVVQSGDAGKSVTEAVDRVWQEVGGELDLCSRVGDLEWDALESVLYAERAALYDPLRAEPHDRLAALIHLGRAVDESPEARYPASRLAHLALEAAADGDRKLAEAGHRALARAATDSPANIELLEARAALELRFGASVEAEGAALAALAHAPKRSRLFALVSEARRMRGDREGARDILEQGFARAGTDPVLLTERGMLAAEVDDLVGASAAWDAALGYEPIFPPAFLNLASLAVRSRDEATGHKLVDRVLVPTDAHPEVLRRALVLALAFEPEGIARAARIARIGERLLSHAPNDVWTLLTTAHALGTLGTREEAVRRYRQVMVVADGTSLAAEAARGLFEVAHPEASAEIDTVVRAAIKGDPQDLRATLARGRSLAQEHAIWTPRFAVAVAERRLGNREGAYRAFESTIDLAPGCVEAHLELSTLAIELDRPLDAVAHAERALELAGPAREVLIVLARALICGAQFPEAKTVVQKLLALDPKDGEARELGALIETAPPPREERPSIGARIARFAERFRR